MRESKYQSDLKKKIRARFPGCHIMKNDSSETQGIPDLLILYKGHWAMLEVKMEEDSSRRPNQDHYVEHFDNMSFASFINPSNEEDVLYALQSAFGLEGSPRVP